MADSILNGLTSATLPAVGTDLIPLARGASALNKVALSDIKNLSTVLRIATIAALKATSITAYIDGQVVWVDGYYAVNDGGQGWFTYNSASAATDDAGMVIAPTTGSGRWIRQIPMDGKYYVDWFGAKASNSSADATLNKTAIVAAINAAFAYASLIGTGFYSKVVFNQGAYYTDAIEMVYAYCSFEGQGSGISRLIQSGTEDKPLIYIYGGTSGVAVPYGGIHNITLIAGAKTYPSVIYYDTAIDNQVMFDDLHASGSTGTLPVDGLSIHNFLNMTLDKYRNDGISGYGIRVRSDLTASNQGITSSSPWIQYRWSAFDAAGTITLALTSSELSNGTAVLLFTTGVLPTRTSTGLALNDAKSGFCYYVGNSTELHVTLHDTEADARTGTNAIILTAATGSGTHQFCNFPSSYQVTSAAAGTNIVFTNDKAVIIPTTVAESGKAVTLGTGNTATGTIVGGGAGGLGGIHMVMVSTNVGGTLDTALTAGRIYYPIYVDSKTIKLANTVALAVAGTAITLNGDGTGQMVIHYMSNVGLLGIGGLSISNWTYDNAGAATTQTTNTIARGGLGLLYANYQTALNKGTINIEGHRIEINKTLASDILSNSNGDSVLIRIETGRADFSQGLLPILLSIKRMTFDLSASLRGDNIRVVGNQGNGDLAPSFEECKFYGISCIYNNDRGTALSKTLPIKDATRINITKATGNRAVTNLGAGNLRLDGAYYTAEQGMQTSPYNNSQLANSSFKSGDLVISRDLGVAYYQAVQSTKGFSKGTGSTNATGTTVSSTAGDAKFVLTARATEQNFGNGASITIPGAGVAAANISGVVANFQQLGTGPYNFELHDETIGDLIPCSTTVAAVIATYNAVKIALVRSYYSVSASLNFPSVAANSSSDLTINAPTGVTFTAGKPCILGLPTNVPAGVTYYAFVTAGGATVTVRCTNATVGAIDPAAGTFTVDIAA